MFRLWKQLRPEYVQVWSVSRCLLLGEKKNPPKFYIIVISVCFSYSKCLRVIELEADENHSYFWMRQALPWPWHGGEVESPVVERGPDQCSLGDPTTPPLNVILRGPHSKISAMGPDPHNWHQSWFQAHPQFITLYLPPYSPFLTVTLTEEFFFTWRRKDHNRLLTNKSLFSRP